MYALVEIKGKQYKAEPGKKLKIDKLDNIRGDMVEFESVLMIRDGGETKIGSPFVPGAKITTTVEDTGRDKKVVIYKFKRRKNYRRKQGHRQQFTVVRVDEIIGA